MVVGQVIWVRLLASAVAASVPAGSVLSVGSL
jgi:hypothetical protein